jgi:hypothetical protein
MTIPSKPSFESKICHADDLPAVLATLATPDRIYEWRL